MAGSQRPLVLFDGDCGLCDGSVRWLLRRDRRGVLRFAPLQSELGRHELRAAGLDEQLSSIVLIDTDGRAHRRSDAAWRIARHLGGPWRAAAGALRLIPRALRDAAYGLIARHRYRLFGRSDVCEMKDSLPPHQRARVLE